MQRRDAGEGLRALDAFERRQRLAERIDQRLRGVEVGALQFVARIGAMQLGRAERGQRVREARGAGPRTRAAQDRKLQRGDGLRVRARRGAEAEARVLEHREQLDRRQLAERRFRHEPREHAGLGVGQRVAAGVVGLDGPAPERGGDAARQRAVRRHQRGGLVVVHRLAQRDRDRERFVLGIRGFDHRDVCQRRVARRFVDALRPALRSHRRPHRLGDEPRARGAFAEHGHVGARDADAPQQRVHGELRMARSRRLLLLAADQRPGLIVEIGVEAGQHHGAARQACDGREQLRGRRHRAGRACGDHRAAMRFEPLAFRLDQEIAPRRRIDLVPLGQDRGPRLAGDLQELERLLPVLVVFARHDVIEAAPLDLPRRHVVHQPRERVGERERGGRAVRDQRLTGSGPQAGRCDPFQHELRQQHAPFEAAERVGNLQRFGAVRHVGEGEFVLVDVAERHEPRQHGRVGLQRFQELRARERASAAGREEQRRVGERERIGRQAADQPAVAQRADQRREKRRGCGNRENAHAAVIWGARALGHDLIRCELSIGCSWSTILRRASPVR